MEPLLLLSYMKLHELPIWILMQSNVKLQGNKSYTNMSGLLFIAHFLVPRRTQHTSHRLFDKHYANDEMMLG